MKSFENFESVVKCVSDDVKFLLVLDEKFWLQLFASEIIHHRDVDLFFVHLLPLSPNILSRHFGDHSLKLKWEFWVQIYGVGLYHEILYESSLSPVVVDNELVVPWRQES